LIELGFLVDLDEFLSLSLFLLLEDLLQFLLCDTFLDDLLEFLPLLFLVQLSLLVWFTLLFYGVLKPKQSHSVDTC
jgi:hypothetical protein